MFCNDDVCVPTTDDKAPLLEPVSAVMGEFLEGIVHENAFYDTWYVPKQFYRLIRVEMWKNHINTSGFKVIYKRPETERFSGWPVYLEHTFGEIDQTSEY